ncbi:MAG: alkaline phosphatase D family protein [Alphaproteobacteria bacterium]|nr:alkaline phosphatase D family protein [Alphaproteobacteria bacterium]MCB9696843.1 alkaline phosphatase D family protein [Alphaproteobacteria bacterium]
MNRREVLLSVGASATLLACSGDGTTDGPGTEPTPAPDRPAEPEPWAAPGTYDEAAFGWSLLAGDATTDGVVLVARTTEPTVDCVVVAQDGTGWTEVARKTGVTSTEGSVRIELDGLTPDTAHNWILASADGARRTLVGRFRTAPTNDGHRKLVIGATSCLNPGGDVGFPGLSFAATERLDAFLLLGDTVYADGSRTVDEYRAFWRGVCATPSFRDLVASTSVIATWDDHEVANNWTLGAGDGFNETLIDQAWLDDATFAFKEAIPMRPGPNGGIWRKLSYGTIADILVMDCRGERQEDVRIVSDEQLQWVTEQLAQSQAAFKIVMVSIHAADHSALLGFIEEEDRWQGYPSQRDVLVAAAEAVPGVLFVTGDMHYGAIQKLSPAGEPGEGLWEFAVGPSGSEVFLLSTLVNLANDEVASQYPVVLEDWNWGRLTLDPGLMTATLELVGDDGSVLGSMIIPF